MSGSGISWAICKSAPRSRQITTPAPHRSVFYRPGALPAAQPTVSKKALGGNGATAQSSAANAGCVLLVFVNVVCTVPVLKIFIFTRINIAYPAAKETENNKLTNLTININSRHILHDEVGNT